MANLGKDIKAQLEAILFLHGEPMAVAKIANLLKVSEVRVKAGLVELKEALQDSGRGLDLMVGGDRAQLVTAPELSVIVDKLTKDEFDTKLTPAALETLAIVAYFGPCTRALIEYVRGVNSAFMLRNLMIRGLIERKGDKQSGNGYIYQATFDFLKHMGIATTAELPDYEKYKTLSASLTRNGNNGNEENI